MAEEPSRPGVPTRTSTHRIFANDSALGNHGRIDDTGAASASATVALRVSDLGRCVNNLESNLRKTFGAAKRTLVSAGKSMSCVSVVASKESRKGEYGTGVGNHDESASDDGETPILSRTPTGTLFEKATRMAQELEVADRQHHLKVYKKCFLGTEAAEWMIQERLATDSESAVRLGNRMVEQGLLKHVTGGHEFEDKDYFYKFSDTVMSVRDMSPSVANLSSDVTRIDRRVAHLLSQLKLHRSLNVALFEQASEQQQKLEDNAQALVQQVASVENALALQVILSGILLCMVVGGSIGFFFKAIGVLMLWRGATLLLKGQDTEGAYQGSTKESKDEFPACKLLDQLRGAGSLPEASETTLGNGDSVPIKKKPSSPDIPEPVTPPTQEDYTNCPDRPCLLRLNRSLGYQKGGSKNEKRWLRMNTGDAFTFETRIFKGRAVLYVAGLDSSPPGLFQGRKRKTHLVVQGQFKRPARFADVLTGQEFVRRLQHIPALPVLNLLLRMAKRLSPSMLAGLEPRPHVLAPVAAGAQVINCSKPGQEPALDNPTEDMRLMGQKFVKPNGDPYSGSERKRIMSDQRNHTGLVYDTQYIWTFHFWQHLLDLSSFKLDMSLRQFSLSGHLDNQPLQLMAKDGKSDEYLWSFEAWHESLLSSTPVGIED